MGFDKETIGTILARCPEIFAASINKTLQRKIELLIFYWVFLKLSFLGLSESIQNYVFLTLTKLCYKGIVLTHLFYILLTIAPVETVAQFGVIFLLFALGLELSTRKLRVVQAVAILGGLLQIFLSMSLCGITASASEAEKEVHGINTFVLLHQLGGI
ncbi:hypothetical protein JHK85_016576 [Glycine max]|nr:hypothetical protein JHK85_016576 [Glycine max]